MKNKRQLQSWFSDEDVRRIAEASQFLFAKGYQLRYVRCNTIEICNDRKGITFFVCLDGGIGEVSVQFKNRKEPHRSGETFNLMDIISAMEHCDFLMENQMEHILWLLNHIPQHYEVFSSLKLCRYYDKLMDSYEYPQDFSSAIYP